MPALNPFPQPCVPGEDLCVDPGCHLCGGVGVQAYLPRCAQSLADDARLQRRDFKVQGLALLGGEMDLGDVFMPMAIITRTRLVIEVVIIVVPRFVSMIRMTGFGSDRRRRRDVNGTDG
ncbi:MAG: hypothetical protein ABFS23_03815 [Pseudomonadota bacterium]